MINEPEMSFFFFSWITLRASNICHWYLFFWVFVSILIVFHLLVYSVYVLAIQSFIQTSLESVKFDRSQDFAFEDSFQNVFESGTMIVNSRKQFWTNVVTNCDSHVTIVMWWQKNLRWRLWTEIGKCLFYTLKEFELNYVMEILESGIWIELQCKEILEFEMNCSVMEILEFELNCSVMEIL